MLSFGLQVCATIFFCFAISAARLPIPQNQLVESTQHFGRRQNGNPNAAGDLYGLGLRLSVYLQITGMLLSCIRQSNSSRSGIKLLAASVCFSLLISWTILASGHVFSACEAWLVLSLIHAYGTPRGVAVNETEKKNGGIALSVSLISLIFEHVVFFWFFASLYGDLPSLGTEDLVWFFTAVRIKGWFRIMMLTYCCLKSILVPFQVVSYFILLATRFEEWSEGIEVDSTDHVKGNESKIGFSEPPSANWRVIMGRMSKTLKWVTKLSVFEQMKEWIISARGWFDPIEPGSVPTLWELLRATAGKHWHLLSCVYGFAIVSMTIAGVEKIIQYNHLAPQNDLTAPGQIIPLTLGAITLLVGAAKALMPMNPLRGFRSFSAPGLEGALGLGKWVPQSTDMSFLKKEHE